ncbi:hypothetical protein FQA39_LY15449 [Lamprigera yunnana]|nr:hypothetical protein FQA39_LY15449 [Lamprigera yunnana]
MDEENKEDAKEPKRPRTSEDFYLFCTYVLEYENYDARKNEELRNNGNHSPPLLSSRSSINSETHSEAASSSQEYKPSEDETDDGSDSYDLVTCYCGKPFAGRPMIECSLCLTWIHLSCARIKKTHIPDLMSNILSTLRGKHLHVQACQIAFNVYQWIKSQNEDQCTKEIKENVSRATGVSIRTIERIIKEGITLLEAKTNNRFQSPKKKNEIACIVTALENYNRNRFSSVTLEDWCRRCEEVIKTECDYLQNEQLVHVRTEKLIISVNGEDSVSTFGIDFEDSN